MNLNLVEMPSQVTRTCRVCGQEKDLALFVTSKASFLGKSKVCKACDTKNRRLWAIKNPDKTKNATLKHDYGISLSEYNKMFEEQQGCCAICGTHQSSLRRGLVVDHCHKTNQIRKLLCFQCNTLLGQAKDSTVILQKAMDYLNGI